MKLTFRFFLILQLLIANFCFAQKYNGEFARQEFNLSPDKLNFFNWLFETRQQLDDFMEIKNGDVVAEVGAGWGANIGVLSLLHDSITFYAEDINAKYLNDKRLRKTISYYEKKRKTKQTNTFHCIIGQGAKTNLPDGIFDKIFLAEAFHEVDDKDAMIEDLATKLKPGGKIIVLDGFSYPGDVQTCPDYGPHVLTMLPVEIDRFKKHGFHLVKIRAPDFKSIHYANGLFFEKDRSRSDKFYKAKNEIDFLANKCARFKLKEIASDSIAMKCIADSILPKIKEITQVYIEYEVWIKEIGVKYLRKKDFVSALNIFSVNAELFPQSYQVWYWLGVAYKGNKQNRLAAQNFKISQSLNPNVKKKN
jgi:SAM-dependent methyltransferase